MKKQEELKEVKLFNREFKKGNCALMGCELDEKSPTLAEIMIGECSLRTKRQARMLIEDWGFSKDDKFCEECFWK